MGTYSELLYENERCFLVEKPLQVSFRTKDRYGSEGFIPWFLRRYSPGTSEQECLTQKVENREFLLIPKGTAAETLNRLEIEIQGATTIRISHPWIEEPVLVPKLVERRHSHCPQWLDEQETNAYRCDALLEKSFPQWNGTCLGDAILFQSVRPPSEKERSQLEGLGRKLGFGSGYWKCHERGIQGKAKTDLSPELLWGEAGARQGIIEETGVKYSVDFDEGYSFGLFLDQRENRHRLRNNLIDSGLPAFAETVLGTPQVLNTFAYTCGFSLCAALAGAKVVSVDLSRKYLGWGERNFSLNGLDPSAHEFLYGDVFGWIKRFRRRDRRFDLIVLDPPTFSRSKEWGVFRVSQDLEKLVEMVVPLLNPNGRLLISSNAATWSPHSFVDSVTSAVRRTGRRVGAQVFATQPWDFGIVSGEQAYLKTLWIEVLDLKR
ncbi:class I SAM-dependent methyltransferase [bacterium]|jgi:23S rRNA (cytosine1962-C5)-methyltransferase|nr:class I SAM-dependent rRNA methyltransferase [Verrucomicrobiota bacterium]MDA7633039.1 class I SAM-dependent methyltransferase [bacterium]